MVPGKVVFPLVAEELGVFRLEPLGSPGLSEAVVAATKRTREYCPGTFVFRYPQLAGSIVVGKRNPSEVGFVALVVVLALALVLEQ